MSVNRSRYSVGIMSLRKTSEGARVYRSRSTRWLGATLAFIYGAVFLVALGGLDGGKSHSTAVTSVDVVVMIVAFLAFIWAVLWFAQMGVTASLDGIVVRNWTRRVFIPWGDILRFEFGNEVSNLTTREHFNSPVLQTYVVTKDGQHCAMSGLSATRINRSESKRRVQLLLDGLEDDRRRAVG